MKNKALRILIFSTLIIITFSILTVILLFIWSVLGAFIIMDSSYILWGENMVSVARLGAVIGLIVALSSIEESSLPNEENLLHKKTSNEK